jgi:sigma-B regulation protein RsbU (phosphoserine phosphatase)
MIPYNFDHHYDSKILIADDDRFNLLIIVAHLEAVGYKNIQTAKDGREALEQIQTFKPHILILDIVMPYFSGFDVIEQLRVDYSLEELPIIVQTSLNNPQEQHQAWLLGANDIITKPIHKLELLSRLHIQLHQYYMHKRLNEYYQKSRDDIENALQLQLSLLPNQKLINTITQKNNVSISSIFKPCRFLSGDLWGLIPIDDYKFAFWSSDFAGKGIPAALNSFRVHTILNNAKTLHDDPSGILNYMNSMLKNIIGPGIFTTFLYGVIDRRLNIVTYAGASHPPLILYEKGNTAYTSFSGKGVPLGVDLNASYPAKTFRVKSGQNILIYSDALFDCKETLGVCLDDDYCEDFFLKLQHETAFDYLSKALASLSESDVILDDDLTFIEILLK